MSLQRLDAETYGVAFAERSTIAALHQTNTKKAGFDCCNEKQFSGPEQLAEVKLIDGPRECDAGLTFTEKSHGG